LSITCAWAATHAALRDPVLNPWRPVTRYPPGTTTAFAVAAGVFATQPRGVSIQMWRPSSIGIREAYVLKIASWFTTQPVLASALPISSMTCT